MLAPSPPSVCHTPRMCLRPSTSTPMANQAGLLITVAVRGYLYHQSVDVHDRIHPHPAGLTGQPLSSSTIPSVTLETSSAEMSATYIRRICRRMSRVDMPVRVPSDDHRRRSLPGG